MIDPVFVFFVSGVVSLLLAAFAVHVCCARGGVTANRRADLLVRELLTPAELDQLHEHGYLEVPSGSTPGRVYRIPAQPGLVIVLDNGAPVTRLCLQPACSVPEREHVLVHKLLLEGAEHDYWHRANRLNSQRWPIIDDAQVELWTGPAPGVLLRR